MFQLVYVSSATWPMNNEDLNRILDISRANNRRLSVTGLLLHIDQGFLQVLEGPKDAVLTLFSRIQKDSRHIGLRVLIQQDIDERLFADWHMGFERLTPGVKRTADIFEITQAAIAATFPSEKAVDLAILLRNFYRVNAGDFAAG